MIRVEFKSNLDLFRPFGWPTILSQVPNKGDYIQNKSGTQILRVASLTYSSKEIRDDFSNSEEPYVIIELTKSLL